MENKAFTSSFGKRAILEKDNRKTFKKQKVFGCFFERLDDHLLSSIFFFLLDDRASLVRLTAVCKTVRRSLRNFWSSITMDLGNSMRSVICIATDPSPGLQSCHVFDKDTIRNLSLVFLQSRCRSPCYTEITFAAGKVSIESPVLEKFGEVTMTLESSFYMQQHPTRTISVSFLALQEKLSYLTECCVAFKLFRRKLVISTFSNGAWFHVELPTAVVREQPALPSRQELCARRGAYDLIRRFTVSQSAMREIITRQEKEPRREYPIDIVFDKTGISFKDSLQNKSVFLCNEPITRDKTFSTDAYSSSRVFNLCSNLGWMGSKTVMYPFLVQDAILVRLACGKFHVSIVWKERSW